MKAYLAKIFAARIQGKLYRDHSRAVLVQEKILRKLLSSASQTRFGRDHGFGKIRNYKDFRANVPVRDYEGIRDYIEEARSGAYNVLWPGKAIYFSKTSGTTSGAKYIPISRASIHNHINGARDALLSYIAETGKSDFVNGKMIFLQGSPELKSENGIKIGRLSGIVAHHVPAYLQANKMPSYGVNCIDDWESKVEAIAEETLKEDMRLISGIPPWVQMYFEMLCRKSGKSRIADIFPNFSLLVYGGVNFKPYSRLLEDIIGKKVDSIEVYPASEGFIAFQDSQAEEGMLLNINSGIFYEFIRAEEILDEDPKRISLSEVELDTNYALILSNNAGLWAYNIGDTVRFTSLSPYRIVVTGRTKHFTSAFGEHVIAEEVEAAARRVSEELGISISEFHVAPLVEPNDGLLPRHEWYIEMENNAVRSEELALKLDEFMQHRNPYYQDLRVGNILQVLTVKKVKKGGFQAYMKSIGKLGGQNKLPRLSNDRKMADALQEYLERE